MKTLNTILTTVAFSMLALGCGYAKDRTAGSGDDIRSLLVLNFLGQTVSPSSTAVVGMYCGSTASLTGAAGGYSTLRTLCRSACGTTTAHVCTAHEMAMTAQFGTTQPTAASSWYAAGLRWDGTGLVMTDCGSFTSASAAISGQVWASTGVPSYSACTTSLPYLCCDFMTITQ